MGRDIWFNLNYGCNEICKYISKQLNQSKHCLLYPTLISTVIVVVAIGSVMRYLLSSAEFRTRLEIIRNLTKNVEFEIRIRGQILSLNSNSTKFDGQICP